jgi:hypothetical protein
MISGPNWARRYGPHQRRLCARPGCGAPAAATLRFQPTQREAWLVDLDDDAVRSEGDLCARHAAGLVLPRGWRLHNDLASERDEATESRAPARRTRGLSVARARRRRATPSAQELPGLSAVVDPPAPEVLVEVEVEVETVVAVPVVEVPVTETPVTESAAAPEPAPLVAPASPEASVELAETLDAQTPLLRRAFRNVSLPENPERPESPENDD